MTLGAPMARSLPATRLPADLDRILRDTSRSVYLTLRVAPHPLRRQLMLAYLFCRAADTIADTRALPPGERVVMLRLYRGQFESPRTAREELEGLTALVDDPGGDESAAGFSAAEAALLRRLDSCFAVFDALDRRDRALIERLLGTLTRGMEIDLETFPPEERAENEGAPGTLETDEDLDRYCYHVAGCVGEFWTDLQAAHLAALGGLHAAEMKEMGVRFGKGLQMTNVLRDLPADLRRGRCYIPRARLRECAIEPAELCDAVVGGVPEARPALLRKLRPVLDDLLDLTLDHYRQGWRYTLSIPRRLPRLRLACAWPLVIGLPTLALLRHGLDDLIAGRTLKIPRRRVYRLLLSSALRVFSNGALDRLYGALESRARRARTERETEAE